MAKIAFSRVQEMAAVLGKTVRKGTKGGYYVSAAVSDYPFGAGSRFFPTLVQVQAYLEAK